MVWHTICVGATLTSSIAQPVQCIRHHIQCNTKIPDTDYWTGSKLTMAMMLCACQYSWFFVMPGVNTG